MTAGQAVNLQTDQRALEKRELASGSRFHWTNARAAGRWASQAAQHSIQTPVMAAFDLPSAIADLPTEGEVAGGREFRLWLRG